MIPIKESISKAEKIEIPSDILVLKNITKKFDGITAVKNLSLRIRKNSVSLIHGPNGAGKTTVFNLISGLIKPENINNSEITFHKNNTEKINLIGKTPYEVSREGIGRIFQQVRIFNNLTALETVMLGYPDSKYDSPFVNLPFMNRIFRLRNSYNEKISDIKKKSELLLDFVGLKDKMNKYHGSLSYGEKKLTALAKLMVSDPSLILLDEPLAGISRGMEDKIIRLLSKIISTMDITIVIIEHKISKIKEICDLMYTLKEGVVVDIHDPGEQHTENFEKKLEGIFNHYEERGRSNIDE